MLERCKISCQIQISKLLSHSELYLFLLLKLNMLRDMTLVGNISNAFKIYLRPWDRKSGWNMTSRYKVSFSVFIQYKKISSVWKHSRQISAKFWWFEITSLANHHTATCCLILISISGHLRSFVRLGQFCVELLQCGIVLDTGNGAFFYWLLRDFAGNSVVIRPPEQSRSAIIL